MIKHNRYLLSAVTVFVSLLSLVTIAGAASGSKAPVTQSYGTTTAVKKGMIVRLNPKDSSKVEPLKRDDSKDMLGVVVAANDAALTLTGDLSKSQAYVATFGKYDVLVSNQNGTIATGDYVSVSTLDGVGMKADENALTVLGKALEAFDGSSNVEGTATLTNDEGVKKEVSLSHINVEISVRGNPLHSAGLPSELTKFLSSIGYSVSNKTVSPTRLYLALLVLIIASVVSASLLYSAVRNAMVSIGRNPLAKSAIVRSLLQVIITSLIIFIIGIFAVYLLLKL